MAPFDKLRTEELVTPVGSRICNWISLVCIVSAVWAMARCDIVSLRRPLEDQWTHWLLQVTAVMGFTGWIFQAAFIVAAHAMGTAHLLAGHGEAPLRSHGCALQMVVLFAAFSGIYQTMASDMGWVHQNWLAEWMGVPGVVVYSTRYIEWTLCGPLVIAVAGHQDPGPQGQSRNGILPSALLTGVYCLNAWIALVVMDPMTSWWNVALAWLAYMACSWEQLHFAHHLQKQGRSGPIRAAMLYYLVVMMGVYGIVYMLPMWGLCTSQFEQRFYCLADVSFKIGMAVVLIVARQIEDTVLVEELRRSAANTADNLQRLIDTASVPIFGVNRDGLVNEWNHKMAELTGLPRERAMGKPVAGMLEAPCREEGEHMFRSSLAGNAGSNCELRFSAHGGGAKSRRATLVVSASPRRDSAGAVVGSLGVGCDLTEIRAVKEAEARKTRFMAVVSHELRSPLHGIIGLSDSLATQETNVVRVRHLNMVKNCASRLLDLVVNIMDMAAMTASEDNRQRAPKPLSCDPVSLPRIIEEVVLLVRNATNKGGHPLVQQGVTLVNEVSDSLPMIEADAHKCTQVFYNIITNACKFTKQGQIRVFSATDPTGEHVEISVQDTGKGIAPEFRERIFEPFEQEDTSDVRHYEGIGLGLAITKEIVLRHGGQITLRSEVGVGSTFTIRLPVRMLQEGSTTSNMQEAPQVPAMRPEEAAEAAAGRPAAAEAPASGSRSPPAGPAAPAAVEREAADADLRSPSVSSTSSPAHPRPGRPLLLSVDDDPVNQAVIAAMLGQEFDICQLMGGQECLAMLRAGGLPRRPAAVLLDVMMPGMSGFEVCRAIREELGLSALQLPVILGSARAHVASSMEEVLASGGNDYLAKPFEREELVARVHNAIRLAAAHEQEVRQAKEAAFQLRDAGPRSPNAAPRQEEVAALRRELEDARARARRELEEALAEARAATESAMRGLDEGHAEVRREAAAARAELDDRTVAFQWQLSEAAAAARSEAEQDFHALQEAHREAHAEAVLARDACEERSRAFQERLMEVSGRLASAERRSGALHELLAEANKELSRVRAGREAEIRSLRRQVSTTSEPVAGKSSTGPRLSQRPEETVRASLQMAQGYTLCTFDFRDG